MPDQFCLIDRSMSDKISKAVCTPCHSLKINLAIAFVICRTNPQITSCIRLRDAPRVE